MLIQAVKLETGPVSTLANDPPPDFGLELLKCQRYQRPLFVGRADTRWPVSVMRRYGAVVNVSWSPQMRIPPVLTNIPASGQANRILGANPQHVSQVPSFRNLEFGVDQFSLHSATAGNANFTVLFAEPFANIDTSLSWSMDQVWGISQLMLDANL